MMKNEYVICGRCRLHLPLTDFHNDRENLVAKQFWGKTDLNAATSLLFFNKGSIVQNLLHKLKYTGHRQVGHELGKILGFQMNDSELFSGIDYIIPIPLHPKKQKKRGYNQSDFIAGGVSEAMNIPVHHNAVVRLIHSETQTRKSRFDRWENVNSIFHVAKPNDLMGKHILIVDDVVTTGSTLEACANQVLQLRDTKVSVATIACA